MLNMSTIFVGASSVLADKSRNCSMKLHTTGRTKASAKELLGLRPLAAMPHFAARAAKAEMMSGSDCALGLSFGFLLRQ